MKEVTMGSSSSDSFLIALRIGVGVLVGILCFIVMLIFSPLFISSPPPKQTPLTEEQGRLKRSELHAPPLSLPQRPELTDKN